MSKIMFDKKIIELGGIEAVLGGQTKSMSEDQLLEVEQRIGVPLAKDYRAFIRKYGASKFHILVIFRPAVSFPDYISSTSNGCFDYFFGAIESDNEDTYALLWAIDSYKDRMPGSLIPIGGNLGGGVVCLGISGKEANKIYYWNPSNEWDEDDFEYGDDIEKVKFQNIHFVADSFTDFIYCLEESPYA